MTRKSHLIHQCKTLFLALGALFLGEACGGEKQVDENLKQAFTLHQEAVKVRNMIGNQTTRLKSNEDSIFVATHTKNLDAISASLEAWDEQLIEVPGFEHEHDHSAHDHDHHHHHHHGQQELTPKQHLEVQQQLLKDIKAIAEKVNTIK